MKSARPHILVLCVLAVLFLAGAHDALRNGLIDLRQSWFPRQASGDIVVIAIDSPSIEKLGGWPWPRSLHGELLAKLDAAGVHDTSTMMHRGCTRHTSALFATIQAIA